MVTTNRRNFAALLTRARREGTLRSYAKGRYARMAILTDGTVLRWAHPSVLMDPCERTSC